MTKYVKNRLGGVSAVADDYDVSGQPDAGLVEIGAAEAREANPQLFGEPDPWVDLHEIHDGHGNRVRYTATGEQVRGGR